MCMYMLDGAGVIHTPWKPIDAGSALTTDDLFPMKDHKLLEQTSTYPNDRLGWESLYVPLDKEFPD